MLVVLEALTGEDDVERVVRVVDFVTEPDPVNTGPVIQVDADVVAGTSEQLADTASGHPDLADRLRDLGAALDSGEDRGVEPVDLVMQIVDVVKHRAHLGQAVPMEQCR